MAQGAREGATGMYRIAIVEDDRGDADRLRAFLGRYAVEKRQEIACTWLASADEFLASYKMQYDIVFMDIRMQGTNGCHQGAAHSALGRKSDQPIRRRPRHGAAPRIAGRQGVDIPLRAADRNPQFLVLQPGNGPLQGQDQPGNPRPEAVRAHHQA